MTLIRVDVLKCLEMIKGTELWPSNDLWDNSKCSSSLKLLKKNQEPKYVEYWLRNYGSQGILQKANGIIFGKPYDNLYV